MTPPPTPSDDDAAAQVPAAGGSGPIRADVAHRRARRRRRRRLAAAAALGAALLALIFLGLWTWRFALSDLPTIPDAAALWSLNRPPGMIFVDRDGGVLGRRGPYHGPPLAVADMPDYLPKAFLAAEDRNFYAHPGVDVGGMVRALRNDLASHGEALQGGSTLTQQLVRTLFLGPEQTFRRKLQEAVLALELERRLSKREILELYLNRIYFGGGAFGVQAAAETYFGKPAPSLTLSEAALLAALPKAPSHLSPAGGLAGALARSHEILAAMARLGWITPAAEAKARAETPKLVRTARSEGDLGYVFDLAAKEARAVDVGEVPDLIVHLSIDAELQAEGAEDIRSAVALGAPRGVSEGALVALAPDGAVLALVGGVDHRLSAFDRATQALRQPGSAFKPIVYAAALEAGLSPSDVRLDRPVRFGDWRPENADGAYLGPVTLTTALARSINTIAARLGHEVGGEKIAALAHRFGLENIPAAPRPPIALGAYEVTLLDLVSAYQVFQEEGRRPLPYILTEITNARGDVLWRRRAPEPEAVFSPARAAQMIEMMQAVITSGTGRRADIGRPAAGKTGTSQEYRDAWFIGFTPELAAGVWLGDDQGRPMRKMTGGELPAETWAKFMIKAEGERPARPFESLRPEIPTPAPPDASGPAADAAGAEPPPRPQGPSPQDPRRAFYADLARRLAEASDPPPQGAPRAQGTPRAQGAEAVPRP